jgi:hypothetical protein
MPKISNKQVAFRATCVSALHELAMRPLSASFEVLDDALEDLALLLSRRYYIPRNPVPKSCHWYTEILPNLDDHRFKQTLRVSREDFGRILGFISGDAVFHGVNSQKQMNMEQQLAITLFKLGHDGTGNSMSNAAAKFGVGDGGTIMKIVQRVIQVRLQL